MHLRIFLDASYIFCDELLTHIRADFGDPSRLGSYRAHSPNFISIDLQMIYFNPVIFKLSAQLKILPGIMVISNHHEKAYISSQLYIYLLYVSITYI